MATYTSVKKRKRRLKTSVTAFIFFLFSLLIKTSSDIFLTSYNAKLTIRIQDCQRMIEKEKIENLKLQNQIAALQSKERVLKIANENDLSLNNDNVVPVVIIDE